MGFLLQKQNKYLKSILSLIFGLFAAISYLLWLPLEQLTWLQITLFFFYLWALFSLGGYFLAIRLLLPMLAPCSRGAQAIILAGGLFGGVWLAHNIPLQMRPETAALLPFAAAFKLIFLLTCGVSLGALILLASAFFAFRLSTPAPKPAALRSRWWRYAAPMLVIWLVYLLAYWPGMMSADSLDQWQQMLTGQYFDHHPVFHTLTIWLVTRVYLSPASVAVAQILFLSLTAGIILAKLETLGVPPTALWLVSFLFALTPVNGAMVNTLWKDIPYSASLLAFSFQIFLIAQSRGAWLLTKWNWLLLALTALLVALFRQSGWPIVTATAALGFVVYFRRWKPLTFAVILCAGLYLLIRGPLYDALHAQRSTAQLQSSTALYQIAADASPGDALDQAFAAAPLLSSERACDLPARLNRARQTEEVNPPTPAGQKIANLVRHAPQLLLFYYRCNRSLVWIIWDDHGEVRNTSHVELLIDSNPFGITPDSKLPALRDAITRYVYQTSHDPSLNWLVWRPALYLYVFLWVVCVAALKQKNPAILLAAAPLLIQSVLSTVINIAPNFRYHYAAYLNAWVFLPLLFLPAPPNAGAQSAQNEEPPAP